MICNKCCESINHSMDYCPFCGHKNTFVRPNIILEKKISQVKEFFKGDSYRDCYKLFSLLLSRKTVQTNTETVTDIVYDTSADKIIDGKTIYNKNERDAYRAESAIVYGIISTCDSFETRLYMYEAFKQTDFKYIDKEFVSEFQKNSLWEILAVHSDEEFQYYAQLSASCCFKLNDGNYIFTSIPFDFIRSFLDSVHFKCLNQKGMAIPSSTKLNNIRISFNIPPNEPVYFVVPVGIIHSFSTKRSGFAFTQHGIFFKDYHDYSGFIDWKTFMKTTTRTEKNKNSKEQWLYIGDHVFVSPIALDDLPFGEYYDIFSRIKRLLYLSHQNWIINEGNNPFLLMRERLQSSDIKQSTQCKPKETAPPDQKTAVEETIQSDSSTTEISHTGDTDASHKTVSLGKTNNTADIGATRDTGNTNDTEKTVKTEMIADSKVICPNCGGENRPTAKFCNRCGNGLIKQSSVQEVVYCDNCGNKIRPGKHFCSVCGNKID